MTQAIDLLSLYAFEGACKAFTPANHRITENQPTDLSIFPIFFERST